MEKSTIVESLREQLREQYKRAITALREASEAATGEDAKAESKYDTRGLESSYLAAGLVEQADRMGKELAAVEAYEFPSFHQKSIIEPGALVEGLLNGQKVYYLLAPGGGGLTIEIEQGVLVTVLGASSPLRGSLIDQKVGGAVEQPPLQITGVR